MSTQEERFAQIAAAIREKDGTTAPIRALDFAERIRAIQTGGGDCGFAVPLVVTVDAGAVVTATHGETTVTGTSGPDGTATLILTASGVWGVTAALGDKEKSVEIEVLDGYDTKISLSSRLPEGYTEVEYIQSSGTQYINSGYKPNNKTQTKADIQFLAGSTAAAAFGFRYSGTVRNYSIILNNGVIRSDFNTYITQTWNDVDPFNRILIDKNGRTTTIDGISKSYEETSFQCDGHLYLFAVNQNGRKMFTTYANLFSCQIYDNGNFVRNYVPCINPSGAAGMFDLVEEKFYPNAGTGDFTPGPAV